MKKIVLLVETSRSFGRQLIMGIANYSKLYGPWSFYKEPIDLKSSIPHLTSWKPDGIIMRDSLITKELLKLNIPTIVAIHNSTYPKKLPTIKTNSKAIAKMASQHFLEKGLKNLAYCGFDDYEWSTGRGKYFAIFNRKAGYKTHTYVQQKKAKNSDWENEQRHVSEWVDSLPKPVAIFACNDDRGQHILEVCKLINLKVPEDVAVIGVDNDPMICDLGDPPLTSIALNVESAGFEAAKLMDHMITNRTLSGEQILVSPIHLVQRQSSDILAVSDPEVNSAINFIKKNAQNKILVKDVVKETSLSRRTLERKFKQTIRRSIYGEIKRVRIELIAKMLIETDLPISHITSLFNFTDVEHISRYFKLEKGIGLRDFRKIHRPG
jgi:LacI family transcriptional regulator